ncbi:MAG: FHA domain-containing protein [Planctomycetes bacterium]|nr:FHA domain-containing protein [Planctomycetota bacterium]
MIRWNRLVISAATDGELASALDEFFPRLLELEYDDVECDMSGVENLGDDGKRAFLAALSSLGESTKAVTLRIPKSLEPFVKKSGVANVPNIRIDLVRTIGAKSPVSPKPQKAAKKPDIGEVTDASGRLIAQMDTKPKKNTGKVKKPISSLGGGNVPLPGGGKDKDDQNRRTLVGFPVNMFDDSAAPPTRRDDEGIEELIVGTDSLSDAGDLEDLPEDGAADVRKRNPADAPEIDVAWLKDKESGEVREIKQELVLGRSAPADWIFEIATISKRHWRIFKQNKRFYLQDMNATNGTFLNGRQVKGAPVVLLDGDVVSASHTLKTPNGAKVFTYHTSKP